MLDRGGPIESRCLGPERSCPRTGLKTKCSLGHHAEREAVHPAASQFAQAAVRESGDNPDCSYDDTMARGGDRVKISDAGVHGQECGVLLLAKCDHRGSSRDLGHKSSLNLTNKRVQTM